jgi:hypothetical protein
MDVTRECDVATEHAWAAFARTEHGPDGGPSVTAVEPPAGEVVAGLRGRVRAPVGAWVAFEVTDVTAGDDPGAVRRWTWRVAGIPATGHRVEPLGPSRCRLVFEVPWWAPAYALVCHVALRRLESVAARLARADGA